MIVEEAELHAFPADGVARRDEAGGPAFSGMHAELCADDSQGASKARSSAEWVRGCGCRAGERTSLAFRPRGERLRSGCESEAQLPDSATRSAQRMTPLFGGRSATRWTTALPALRKFYERTAEENSVRITNRLHQKGQRKRRQSCMIVVPSLEGSAKKSCRFVTLFVLHALLPIRCP